MESGESPQEFGSSHAENVRTLGRASSSAEERLLWQQLRDANDTSSFYTSWLGLQIRAIAGARSGVLVEFPEAGGEPVIRASWPPARVRPTLVDVARQAITEARPLAVEFTAESTASPGFERAGFAVLATSVGGTRLGVAIEVEPMAPEALVAASRVLEWGRAWPELHARQGNAGRAADLLGLITSVSGKKGVRAAATALAGELAAKLASSRVAIGLREGQGVAVVAMSDAATFDRRTDTIRLIESVMDETVHRGITTEWRSPDARRAEQSSSVPGVLRAHESLAALSGSRAILSVPFDETGEGALLVEFEDGAMLDSAARALSEICAGLIGPELRLREQAARHAVAVFQDDARSMLAELGAPLRWGGEVLAVFALLVAFLFLLLPTEYRVTAEAEVEAEELRAIVAPFDGYVGLAPASAGDVVREGDPLVSFDDRDLRLEAIRWESEVLQLERQHREALADHDAATARVLRAQLDRASAQSGLAARRLSMSELASPIDGVVVSGDLSQRLGAPVERGDVLYEVAPAGGFRIAIFVSESDIDDVVAGQRGRMAFSARPGDDVGFFVARVTPVSEAREGVNAFRLEAELDEVPSYLAPGLEGVAKIEAGERNRLWIWSHGAIDRARIALWRWWP